MLMVMRSLFTLLLSFTILSASATNFKGAKVHYTNGMTNIRNMALVDAISEFTMAIDLYPDYAEAYYQRGVAKTMLAQQTGRGDAGLCYDLTQALKLGYTKASALIQETCMSECYTLSGAATSPELVFCGEFTSSGLTTLPEIDDKLENIARLNLSGNRITSINEIQSLSKSLLTLDLSSNGLTEVSSLGSFKALQELNLSANKITSLPDDMYALAQLKHLYISKNGLQSLPASVTDLDELETLDLRFNQLTELPKDIRYLSKLRTLHLEGNNLSDAQVKKYRKMLPNCNITF
jgi:hypothetical protein